MLSEQNASKILEEAESVLDYVKCINDPYSSFERLLFSFAAKDRDPAFLLCLAGSKVCLYEGISAAGCDPAARCLTPALDAEALLLGKTISASKLPVSPQGIVSPVVITRACLGLLATEAQVVDCGTFYPAKLSSRNLTSLSLSAQVAECPSSGEALPELLVLNLFAHGIKIGESLAQHKTHIVIAECVPGGTTTALALLSALGHEVNGLLSSSLPYCNHELRWRLVQDGLAKAKFSRSHLQANPLTSVSALGDPMQAVVAGIALSASAKIPTYLAGGSQMLAVWALIKALSTDEQLAAVQKNILVLSTKWVAQDPSAGVSKLACMLAAPFAVSAPDFLQSSKAGLRAYEEGNVKEGVGAGAAMCLARIAGFSASEILRAIDSAYDEFL